MMREGSCLATASFCSPVLSLGAVSQQWGASSRPKVVLGPECVVGREGRPGTGLTQGA